MEQSGRFDQRHRVAVTIAFVLAGTLAAGVAQVLLNIAYGFTTEDLQKGLPPYSPEQTIGLVGISQLLSYLLPGLLAARALYGSSWLVQTGLRPPPQPAKLLIGIGIFLATLLLTAALAEFNQSLELAEWMRAAESGVSEVLEAIIIDTSWGMFGLVLLVVAILPAIGEELVFRGLIQPGIIARSGSTHVGVWLTAIMFGLVHVQFAGILPRIFLGAVLGFLAVASQRLWVPIVAHALFNGVQVVAARLGELPISAPEPELPGMTSVYMMLGGGLLAGLAFHFGLPHLAPENPLTPDMVEEEDEEEEQTFGHR